jgi:hypothetical protein
MVAIQKETKPTLCDGQITYREGHNSTRYFRHGAPYTTVELAYMVQHYRRGNVKYISMDIGRTEHTIKSVVGKLKREGLAVRYQHLDTTPFLVEMEAWEDLRSDEFEELEANKMGGAYSENEMALIVQRYSFRNARSMARFLERTEHAVGSKRERLRKDPQLWKKLGKLNIASFVKQYEQMRSDAYA